MSHVGHLWRTPEFVRGLWARKVVLANVQEMSKLGRFLRKMYRGLWNFRLGPTLNFLPVSKSTVVKSYLSTVLYGGKVAGLIWIRFAAKALRCSFAKSSRPTQEM